MIKNFLNVFLLILVLILGAGSGIFGYLYYTKNNEYNDLLTRVNDGTEVVGSETDTTVSGPVSVTFEDTPLEVSFQYPSTWKLVLGTNVSEDFAYEPVYGRLLQNYKATLKKGTSTLTFEKILGAVDGFPTTVDKSTIDFEEVEGNLVRYKQPSESKWKYVQVLNCDDFSELFGAPAASDTCVSTFYSGFGNWANIAYVTASNEADLAEADQIVISALN